jgi:formylglycine-generating enzyme required for sulfatase activity
MSDKDSNTNADKEFDGLLNKAFQELDFNDPKNATILSAMSDHVMGEGTFNHPQTNKLNEKKMFKLNLNAILLIVCISAAILIPALIYTDKSDIAKPVIKQTVNPLTVNNPPPGTIQNNTGSANERADQIKSIPAPVRNESLLVVSKNIPKEDCVAVDNLPVYTEQPVSSMSYLTLKANPDSEYAFPKLTEEEMKANTKQKNRMIDQVVRYSKSKYLPIPQASFSYQGTIRNISKFYMQTTEVCNLDYRTFLFDLLIQGRKTEFLKAKPDQQKWLAAPINGYAQTMAENYFSSVVYDGYPVVNISREGAEMYCLWLTEEANKRLTEKSKPLIRIALPGDAEWTYAGSGGLKDANYPWSLYLSTKPYYATQNLKATNLRGCFLANLCFKKNPVTVDTASFCGTKPFPKAYTTAGLMMGEGTFIAPISSYNPNDFGLYCMSGNVAEMVYVTDAQNPKLLKPATKGGSWNSDEKHVQLNGEDEYAGITSASPYIGFRVMIVSK